MSNEYLKDPQLKTAAPGNPKLVPPQSEEKRFVSESPDAGEDNRGRRPGMTEAGDVTGSGSGAGGGGSPEDIDSDSTGGGGKFEMPKSSSAGSDAENSNS